MTLTATAAAAAIGLINLVGNLGGFIGPYANGSLMTLGYSDALRVGMLSLSYVIAAVLAACVRIPRQNMRTPESAVKAATAEPHARYVSLRNASRVMPD
jgi:nitrate/nitrite transporter NarK